MLSVCLDPWDSHQTKMPVIHLAEVAELQTSRRELEQWAPLQYLVDLPDI